MVLFGKHLRLDAGSAVVNVLAQRLLDVAVLGSLFVVLGLLIAPMGTNVLTTAAVVAVVIAVVIAMSQMPSMLELVARPLVRSGTRRWYALARPLLRARRWYRHQLGATEIRAGVLATLARWSANIAAIVAIILVLNIDVSATDLVLVATAYNAIAIVPLHTVGGIGFSDAGLTALLTALGTPVALAAAAALLLRAVMVTFPLIFWALVFGLTKRPQNAA